MSYDSWKTNADFMYEDEPEGYTNNNLVVDHDYCATTLEDALHALYITGNVKALENALDCLVHEFRAHGYEIEWSGPDAHPKLKRSLVDSFIDLTREYADSFKQAEGE